MRPPAQASKKVSPAVEISLPGQCKTTFSNGMTGGSCAVQESFALKKAAAQRRLEVEEGVVA
ncbi:MAG TPA: hypothetical protein VD887_11195 [Allosphingosinicella sp.]|nr:hypothetical protein [Allosphingosinicella sp.]